ncbi:MAG TPA: YkgJ family cysteine cluster protein [Acidisarcina sp.]|nr:YkgJ family cysteine cluster protein [Acidisarcina sp.]
MPLKLLYAVCMGSRGGDAELVQILDAALADAARRSGAWLACRPGCTQCCIGVFAVNQLDADRLRNGLAELALQEPARAAAIRERATASIARLAPEFPGDAATGILAEGEEAEAQFEDFANDEPCPALDPATGLCDLYSARPTTCRVFGPPARSGEEGGLGVCELCFHGASEQQIAACEMEVDPDGLEDKLLAELEERTQRRGRTIVAYCLTEQRG